MKDIFKSAVQTKGDLAGVFEFDGDTSYFYLYQTDEIKGNKVLNTINVGARRPDFSARQVKVFWRDNESLVCLAIKGQLLAVFDCNSGENYGGNYEKAVAPVLDMALSNRIGRV